MTTLIVLVVLVVSLFGVTWVAGQRHAARRHHEATDEAAACDLYDRYLDDVETLTQAYLLQAPSDEEWLAGIKKRTAATNKMRQQSDLAAMMREMRRSDLAAVKRSEETLDPIGLRTSVMRLLWEYALLGPLILAGAVVIGLGVIVALIVVTVLAVIHPEGLWVLLGLGPLAAAAGPFVKRTIEAGRHGALKSREHEQ